MGARITTELLRRPEYESECDWCGQPLRVGDRVRYDHDQGLAYCSHACAALHQRERSTAFDRVGS